MMQTICTYSTYQILAMNKKYTESFSPLCISNIQQMYKLSKGLKNKWSLEPYKVESEK